MTGKRWTEVLCMRCGGNGVVKIPGGVSTCDHCEGRCYEPEQSPARAPEGIPGWQPIESAPKDDRPFLVLWDKSLMGRSGEMDIVSRREYEEIIGFGEPPALAWHPLPPLPALPLPSGDNT